MRYKYGMQTDREQQDNNKRAPTPASWKPGQSGNPNGRPKKGYSITDYFQRMLASQPKKKRKLALAIFQKALEGDVAAQKLIWQYMDGMPEGSLPPVQADVKILVMPSTIMKKYGIPQNAGEGSREQQAIPSGELRETVGKDNA